MVERDWTHQRTIKVGDKMAFADKMPEMPNPVIENDTGSQTLRQQAVAIDPPPLGAIGIEELLGRFENLAQAGTLTEQPEKGAIGVRDLLERLNNLAEAGHFYSNNDDTSDGVYAKKGPHKRP